MVKIIPNFLNKEECNFLIKAYSKFSWLKTESTVTTDFEKVDENFRKSKYIRFYKNYDAFLPKNYLDKLYSKVIQTSLQNFPYYIYENQYEDIKIIEYNKGDYFDWHYDCLGVGAERKLNFSIQLTDDSEYIGADIEFFKLRSVDFSMFRQRGAMILYPSFLPHRVTELKEGKRLCVVGHLNGTPFS